ncbi:hypothetical protein HanXRQr2_Chr17g0809291 [Helianthus annuus]|uniref:Uncharacterized protein n=1 Tax=Helianthus annuus TaxID=4232 RepID=A0A9K3DI90_HELAN|nr:hypothetical protein HanXRQr2_Chr17g0809291 [Helianthus annuus]
MIHYALATGWFSQHILEILRLRVKVRFLSVYPNPGADSFLKSASLHLEKLKRAINVIKEKIVNKDEVHVEENEMSNDEDDDMEDDIEDENADEDFDAYEGLDMGGDGNDTLPDSSYINQENVSKTYLQELFGSFPNNGRDAENSDEEYHIFDGSNSEDEDEDDY